MRDRLRSVRVRITALAAVIVVLAVSLSGWLLVRTVEDALERHAAQQTREQVDFAADQLAAGVAPAEIHPVPGTFALIQVLDAAGQPVAPSTEVPALAVVVGAAGPGSQPATIEIPIGDLAAGTVPVRYSVTYESVTVGQQELTVVAASSLADVERSVRTLKRALAVGLPFLVLAVVALTWFVVGRSLRPVEAIRAEVEAISTSTIHRRVPEPSRRDEIGRLARTMNAMLDRLERGSRRQRQFVSDASHELRTPMASMRTQLEVAQRRGVAANWPAVASSVLAQEDRLEGLVADLLALARDDEDPAVPDAEVDLGALAAEEAARPRRVRVGVAVAEDRASVRGEASALRSLVAHLLDNAARHARRRVQLSVAIVDGRVALTIDDDGPGIAAEERERVFERFTRLDVGRTRDRGGAGLGLAVVRAVARTHGGDVRVDDSPFGGARLVVALPVGGAPAGQPAAAAAAGGAASHAAARRR